MNSPLKIRKKTPFSSSYGMALSIFNSKFFTQNGLITVRTSAIIGLLLALGTIHGEESSKQGMLENGGFEEGDPPREWSPAFDVTLSQDVNPHSGSCCLKIVQSGKNKGYAKQDVFPVSEEKYELTLWYKCQPGSTARIEMWDHENGKTIFAVHKTETEWTEYKRDVLVPPGCNKSGVLLSAFGTGNVVWYDDVSIEKIEK